MSLLDSPYYPVNKTSNNANGLNIATQDLRCKIKSQATVFINPSEESQSTYQEVYNIKNTHIISYKVIGLPFL